jgi:hypothetical protein
MKITVKAFVLMLLFSNTLLSQLDNGSIYPINIEGKDVLSNQDINVQNWLDDGKPVLVSFFTSWSKQSWEYYNTNWLNDLNAEFGQSGTNQIRILGVEAEPYNSPDQLKMEIAGTRPLKSYGNWLAISSFPIIDDASFNLAFSADLFPITYVIRPNGTMIELNRNGALLDRAFILRALFPKSTDLTLNSNIRDASFCGGHTIPSSNISMLNMGNNPIENLVLEYYIGQSKVQTIPINQNVGPLAVLEFETNDQLVASDSEVTIFISNVNNESYPIDEYNIIEANVIEPILDTEILKMKITFDKYPQETQWILQTESGVQIASDSYSLDEVEPWGTLEYEFEIPEDAECLNLVLQDSYGDGWTQWGVDENGINTPIPGIQFFNQYNALIKDKHNIENSTNFKVDLEAIDLYIKRDAISTDKDIIISSDINVYPSPVVDILNIDGLENLTEIKAISIINSIGKAIYNFDNQELNNKINVSELNSGIYFTNILTQNGLITKSFIKE